MEEVIKRVTERDIELPHEVTLHYFLYCLNLKSGKVEWKKEFHTGRPPGAHFVGVALRGHPSLRCTISAGLRDLQRRVATEGHPYN